MLPSLIGKGGATIRALQEATGATVHADSGSGEVRIEGPEAAVAAARARIAAHCHLDQAAETVPLEPAALDLEQAASYTAAEREKYGHIIRLAGIEPE
jgi:polyribonucleotide nucleotidyltransferase